MRYYALEAAIEFFGLREGQTRMEFAKGEWSKLSDADKLEITEGLRVAGFEIVKVK